MKYYINALSHSSSIKRDIKELIPQMNMRRRMSKIVRVSVATALDSLADFGDDVQVDAIITATSLGCISDTEMLLADIVNTNEDLVNPKFFVQSTFNVVSSQIALLKGLTCYNNTFVHSNNSFESAILDAMACLNSGKHKAVLVGVFDEFTDIVLDAYKKLSPDKKLPKGELAVFFVLSLEPFDSAIAEIQDFKFLDTIKCDSPNVFYTKDCPKQWIGNVLEIISNSHSTKEIEVLNTENEFAISSLKVKCL